MNHISLSPARQRLVRLMQSINFGRIERMLVRAGEPVFDHAPRVVRTVKLAADNGPRAECALKDFLAKRELVEFFEQLDRIDGGIIPCIEIRHGLPLLMEIEESFVR
jgi:hypothetical protein